MRRKDLRIGDVINEMQFGELAIPTAIGIWADTESRQYTPSKTPVYFRESDGVLVNTASSLPLVVGKAREESTGSLYIIVSKEEYETYRDTGVLPE